MAPGGVKRSAPDQRESTRLLYHSGLTHQPTETQPELKRPTLMGQAGEPNAKRTIAGLVPLSATAKAPTALPRAKSIAALAPKVRVQDLFLHSVRDLYSLSGRAPGRPGSPNTLAMLPPTRLRERHDCRRPRDSDQFPCRSRLAKMPHGVRLQEATKKRVQLHFALPHVSHWQLLILAGFQFWMSMNVFAKSNHSFTTSRM